MRGKGPCYNCQNRYPGCQSRCETGLAYSKRRKEERELIKAEKSRERIMDYYKIQRVLETKRKCGIE